MESWYLWKINCVNLWDFQVILDPRGILDIPEDHFLNLWDFQAILDPRGILVCLEDQFFESLRFPNNVGSAWNLCIFGRSFFES